MTVLVDHGVTAVPHFTPLHYLPFISRSRALKSKPTLAADGFDVSHLRSKSQRQDQDRGFGEYAFLTLESSPRILKSKLTGGFPHIAIEVPAPTIDANEFHLCRYNVAMTRRLRRGDTVGFPESASNGQYYDGKQIPIAKSDDDKACMLKAHFKKTMIEVLIPGTLNLCPGTRIICYDKSDFKLGAEVLEKTGTPWALEFREPPTTYRRNANHVKNVEAFILESLEDPKWRGNGLEFDKV